MGYMSGGYIFIVGRAKDMIIINGRNHWPQDIEWAVEQLPGFKSGDIAAFAITGPSGEETPAVLVHCRVSDPQERGRLRDDIRERVRAITGITPVVELVPPRTLPRTSSGKLSRTKARNLYLTGEIQPLRHRGLSTLRRRASPLCRAARPQECSSVGRASVSKTEGRGFESLHSCQP